MQEVRAIFRLRDLGDVFDAYEIFCSGFGWQPGAWRMLALQVTTFLDSKSYTPVNSNPLAQLRSQDMLARYLHRLDIHQVGHLTNDILAELFYQNDVLDRELRFYNSNNEETDVTYVGVAPLKEIKTLTESQQLVRTHYAMLDNATICFLAAGISSELRSRAADVNHRHQSLPFWMPCNDSHVDILLRMNIRLKRDDVRFIEKVVASRRHRDHLDAVDTIVNLNPTLIERAVARAGFLLNGPKRVVPTTHLGTIQEIDGETRDSDDHMTTVNRKDMQTKRSTKRSSYSDYRSFVTALTHRSNISESKLHATAASRTSVISDSLIDKRSTAQTFISCPAGRTSDPGIPHAWSDILKQKDIIPDPELQNWSDGRGQHAEFRSDERHLIPLRVEHQLGKGGTAVVESVQCKRVRLVKKVIICNKKTRINREDAIGEIQQLYRAQHTHIVRLVGTYVIEDELAILTYPCAEWNLEEFLSFSETSITPWQRSDALRQFFTCLIRVLDFIHSFPIKHMDIKPQNILVRNRPRSADGGSGHLKIYLTDFGSSRFYPSVDATETDTWTPFTRTYAAKEVVLQEMRGLSADIFSLACVFAEMLAGILDGENTQPHQSAGNYRQGLKRARSGADNQPRPYYSKLASVCQWLRDLPLPGEDSILTAICVWTFKMLNNDPGLRPTAREMANDPALQSSCTSCAMTPGPEKFEAAISAMKTVQPLAE